MKASASGQNGFSLEGGLDRWGGTEFSGRLSSAMLRAISITVNDGVVTQTAEGMNVVYRLWRRSGTEHVLRVLEDAAKERLADGADQYGR